MSFNYDQLNGANLPLVCKQTFALVSAMDDVDPGTQVASALLLAKLVCQRKGVDLRDAMPAVSNLMADGLAKNNEHIKALLYYCEHNL